MITELELHAFDDDELAADEHARVLEATEKSIAFRAQLIELQQLENQVRASYQDIKH